jgi:predicted rRNA methylase YqxC with S4 and FtsJ domains
VAVRMIVEGNVLSQDRIRNNAERLQNRWSLRVRTRSRSWRSRGGIRPLGSRLPGVCRRRKVATGGRGAAGAGDRVGGGGARVCLP